MSNPEEFQRLIRTLEGEKQAAYRIIAVLTERLGGSVSISEDEMALTEPEPVYVLGKTEAAIYTPVDRPYIEVIPDTGRNVMTITVHTPPRPEPYAPGEHVRILNPAPGYADHGTVLDLAGDPPQYRVRTDHGIILINHDQLRPAKHSH